jgi:hypothetical protein
MSRSLVLPGILAILLVINLLSCKRDNESYIIGLKQNIHHDDFEYSVTSFTKTAELSEFPGQTTQDGVNYYLVHFKVENRALRVDHQWDNSIGYIVDDNGMRYENSKEEQKLLDKSLHFGWKEQYNTLHGTSDSTILVFKLPLSGTRPYLMVRGGILMGDVFDKARFRKMKVKLY